MVKQDAMNVFLGFYIPSETSMHLWDLDSDYYLHNRYLRPPTPYINRILYEQNRLNRSNSDSDANRVEMMDTVNSTSMSKHLKISKKYFIQSPALLKLKALEEKVEKVEKVDGLKGIEGIEKLTIRDKGSDSGNETEIEREDDHDVSRNVLVNEEEDRIDEMGEYKFNCSFIVWLLY